MNVLPTAKVMKFATMAPQAVLMLHIGKVLIDIGVVASMDDYCVNWLGQSPYLFQVPPEFVWLDDEMRRSLIDLLGLELIAAGDLAGHAGSKAERDALCVRIEKMVELYELVQAIPTLY